MIDSHCHLADAKFEADLSDVIARAKKAGVEKMITIADSIEEAKRCIEIAEKHSEVFASVGVHPHNAKDWAEGDIDLLKNLAQSSPRVRAIGEIGLDYHYMHSPKDVQIAVFREQLELAKDLDLPVVVHCRSAPNQSKLGSGQAVEDVWRMVSELQPKKMVLHCCTEKWNDPASSADYAAVSVERFIEAGYLLSFTGIATYPTAEEIRNTIRHCPLEQMMIETDAPYLAPVPHRWKRNEPAFVVEIAKFIAELKEISMEEVDRATTENAVRFFGI